MIRSTTQATERKMWVLLAGLALVASSLFSARVFDYQDGKPGNGHLIPRVPFEQWLKRDYCGPACLSMVLNYWDQERSYSQGRITDEIYDFQNRASYNSGMVLYPRTVGFASYSVQGSLSLLKEIVSQDIPVIVLTQSGKQSRIGHYRVVIGFDEGRDLIVFHDPYYKEGWKATSGRDFMKIWDMGRGPGQARWMMAIVPGEHPLPFPALLDDPMTAIDLATAYYRRSDFAKSRTYWEKACQPGRPDPRPLYSLAMVSLREGNPGDAQAYASKALGLAPGNAYAHDVLGLAYARQGRLLPALQSLSRALRLAPKETFIRKHYLAVRALYIQRARLEGIHNKENANE